jgi:hypothetical protein
MNLRIQFLIVVLLRSLRRTTVPRPFAQKDFQGPNSDLLNSISFRILELLQYDGIPQLSDS